MQWAIKDKKERCYPSPWKRRVISTECRSAGTEKRTEKRSEMWHDFVNVCGMLAAFQGISIKARKKRERRKNLMCTNKFQVQHYEHSRLYRLTRVYQEQEVLEETQWDSYKMQVQSEDYCYIAC